MAVAVAVAEMTVLAYGLSFCCAAVADLVAIKLAIVVVQLANSPRLNGFTGYTLGFPDFWGSPSFFANER